MPATRIQVRRDTAANWLDANPILSAGEIGFENDTQKFKIGDDSTTWEFLPYYHSEGNSVVSFNTRVGQITLTDLDIQNALNYIPADNADLSAEITNRQNAINTAATNTLNSAENYTDTAISTEVTNRNSAISSAISTEVTNRNSAIATAKSEAITAAEGYTDSEISTEVTNRNSAISSAISTEVINRNNAISTAKSEAISSANSYTDTQISTSSNQTASDIQDAKDFAVQYTDAAIEQEIIDRNSAIQTSLSTAETYADTKKSEAISASETYTDNQITNLINGAPATLDTLKELADALGSDPNLATTITNNIATALSSAEDYTDAAISTEVTNRNNAISTAKSEAISTSETYTDTQISTEVTNRNTAISTALTTAEGYTDSAISQEVTDRNSAIATAKSEAISTSESFATNAANTAQSNAESYTDTQISTEVTNRNTAISTALTTAEGYTDSAISTEITNRNNAIATAKSEAISTSEGYTDSAISTEVTNRNSAIATAKSEAISTAEGYTDSAISTEVTNRNNAIATAKSEAISTSEGYTDSSISTEINNRNSAIATAKSEAISTSEGYTDSAISTEITNRNTAIATAKSEAISTSEAYTDSAISTEITNRNDAIAAITTTGVAEGTNLYFTNERAQDAVANALTAGTAISINYDDPSNTITIGNTGVTSLNGTTDQITASSSTGGITLSLPNNVILPGSLEVNGNAVIDGDLTVKGTTVTINTQNYSVQDNLIYLNAALDLDIQSATHNTTTVTYRFTDTPPIVAGMAITVTGATPSDYNISSADNIVVDSVSASGGHTDVTVTKIVTVAYTSGGTAHFKTSADPDLGFAGGYYESGYKHAGIFRDASDSGKFKFFQGYTPEPDESVNIDTTHASFALAPLQASSVTATTFTGNLTGNVTGNADTATVLATSRDINGVAFNGSAPITIKASTTQPLTIGTGLSGTSFDGGTAVTIAIDSTVTTNSGIQTLTNKSISGSSNTLTNIPNSALTNSSITINGSAVSLGGSVSITSLPTQTSNSGKFLTTDGTNASWALVPLSTGVTETLPTANGGTNISTYTTGDMLYASATNTLSKLTAGTNGYLLTMVAGVPAWAAAPISLPSQTGNSGKILTTDGTTASWIQNSYSVVASSGTSVTARPTLNFVNATVTDDSVNNRTTVTISTSGTQYQQVLLVQDIIGSSIL